MKIAGADLHERDRELAAIAGAIDGARGERGNLLVLEGAAGTGKSTLLTAAATMARTGGMRVIEARAGELERGQPFGVVRQLFEPTLTTVTPSERARLLCGAAAPAAHVLGMDGVGETGHAAGFAVMHALYWLAGELARRRPLVAIIDDAHWADGSSLRALDFLARRLGDLPIAVCVAFRPDEPGAPAGLLDALRDNAGVRLQPGPLGREAVAAIVRSRLPDAVDETCDAFWTAAAGNPLYVTELLRAVHINGEPLRPHDVDGTTVRFIGERALRRVERVGDGASELARAMAILGEGTRLDTAAALASLDLAQAGEIAHRLRRIEILLQEDPVAFVHPLVRASIDDTIPAAERQRAHRRAAALLARAGAPAEDQAAHLTRLTPSADPEVAETLAAAAGDALERAAAEEAIAWLQRALDEGAARPEPAGLLARLGAAKAILRDPTTVETLDEAYRRAPDSRQRARIGILLAEVLAHSGLWTAARDLIQTLEREIDPGDAGAVTELAAIRAAATMFDPGLVDDFEQRLAEYERLARLDGWGSDALSALLASGAAQRGRLREGLAHADRARASGRLFAERGAGAWTPPQLLSAYVVADELDTADCVCNELEAAAGAAGASFGTVTAVIYRAWIEARRGELSGAEAVLGPALELARETGLLMVLTTAAFLLVDVVIERSLSEIAGVVERTELPSDFLATCSGAMLLEARGRLRMAGEEREAAVADLRAAGEINDALGFGPAWSTWRSSLALALPRAQRDDARELAAEELARARSTGPARGIGIALRTLGLLHDGAEGIDLLRESVAVLEDSPARLEYARALVALGAALRRSNRRRDAREPIVAGLRVAHACGALRLREQADRELAACGGRRPRLMTAGRDSLTASELRVAELATSGASNAAIAQTLFVSVKTVETHLSRAYGKLALAGPGSRGRLAVALADPAP